MGEVFFVDCDAGIDALGRGTYLLPLATIDYAISNYAVAWRNDAFICWGSAGGGFDENANADGVQVDVPSTVICGYNNVRVDNTNGAVTSVFHVLADSCWILGFTVQPTAAVMGINVAAAGTQTKIGYDDSFYNTFISCAEDVRMAGASSKAYYNKHSVSLIGYDLQAALCQIFSNDMRSAGGANTVGIVTTGAGDNNFIRENVIFGYETGISLVNGSTGNIITENSLFCTANNIVDANAGVLSNAWVNNKTRSLISHTNTIQQDLKKIFDEAEGGGGGGGGAAESTRVGNTYFVSRSGSDANGDGSLGDPWRTIDFAVGRCTANNNDMIIVFSPTGGTFDENAGVNGVDCDVAGITVQGVDYPSILNTNGGALSVFRINASGVKIKGFRFEDAPPPPIFQIITGAGPLTDPEVSDCIFNAVQSAIYYLNVTRGRIYGNRILNVVNSGIYIQNSTLLDVYENEITRPGVVGVEVTGGSLYCKIYKNRLFGGAFGIGLNMVNGQDNSFEDNYVARFTPNIQDVVGLNDWINNHLDQIYVTHVISAVDGVAIIVMDNFPMLLSRSGGVSIHIDTTALDVNEIGSVCRFRYAADINGAYLDMGYLDYTCGVDIVRPRFQMIAPGGRSWGAGNLTLRLSAQMNVAVGANRTLPITVVQEG